MAHDLHLSESRRSDWVVSHQLLDLHTRRPREFVDVTEAVIDHVRSSGVIDGLLTVQTLHTTTGIVINEHEPLLLEDLTEALHRWAPQSATYRHDDLRIRRVNLTPDEPANGHAHAQALLLRTSESLAVVDGDLRLGRWQRIFLAELDGPRQRNLSVTVMGVGASPRGARRLQAVAAAAGALR